MSASSPRREYWKRRGGEKRGGGEGISKISIFRTKSNARTERKNAPPRTQAMLAEKREGEEKEGGESANPLRLGAQIVYLPRPAPQKKGEKGKKKENRSLPALNPGDGSGTSNIINLLQSAWERGGKGDAGILHPVARSRGGTRFSPSLPFHVFDGKKEEGGEGVVPGQEPSHWFCSSKQGKRRRNQAS